MILSVVVVYEDSQDQLLWLRDLLHKLQPSVREWWCAPPVEVIRTGTFLYFVDELRLVRHTRGPGRLKLQTWTLGPLR